MKKKSLIFLSLLSVSILLVPVFFTDPAGADEGEETKEYYEDLMRRQVNAVGASKALKQAFGFDETGNIQYPPDFAGMWLEGEILVVALTDVSEDTMAQYRSWAGTYSGCLQFKEAQYSYVELMQAKAAVTAELWENHQIMVLESYVSEAANMIVIGVDEPSLAIIEASPSLIDYDYPIQFKIGSYSRPTASIGGGESLRNNSSYENITMSCAGTYRGSKAALSCGHIYQNLGDEIYSYGLKKVIGNVVYHQFNNGSGDYEIISMTDLSASPSYVIAKNYSVKSTVADVSTGTVVRFYGRKSDYVGYGTVSQRGMKTTYIDENGNVIGVVYDLSRIKVTYGGNLAGDSGGPIFSDHEDGGKWVNYCGVLNGSSKDDGYLYIVFTPYTYPYAAGFTVATYQG